MLISISGSYIGSTLTVRSQFDTAFSIRECKPYRVPIRCFFLSSLTSGLGKLPAGYRKCTSSYWLIDEEEMLALIATAFTKVTTGHIVRQHLFVYRPKLTPAVESRTYIRQSVFWCTLSVHEPRGRGFDSSYRRKWVVLGRNARNVRPRYLGAW